ncbi:hypothetical protein EJ110_NYTH40165 [Nymphaea thermarum]|nr:hypothetical protein EJ110_NYTH40165 [Nymphaea thermarum]
MAQCTRDFTMPNCTSCLANVMTEIPACCSGRNGGIVYTVNCGVRYEVFPFTLQPGTTASPNGDQTTNGSSAAPNGSSLHINLIQVVEVPGANLCSGSGLLPPAVAADSMA